MDNRQYALELLSQGISPTQVAAAIGVDDSRISQLMAEEDFQEELNRLKVAATAEDLAFDKKLESAELQALDNIERRLPIANMQQSLQAFKVLNTARRRKDGNVVAQGAAGGVVVNITLPAIAMPQFVLNQKAEVIEVEGKTMISATPKQLQQISAARQQRVEQVQIESPQKQEKAKE
ncbi:MAG TPA: hypothetical protein V6C65_24090, partial [Allocoleopsis sp.]